MLKLHLLAPLLYEAAGTEPALVYDPSEGERILSFSLNSPQAESIEPEPALYLETQSPGRIEVPAGVYLFTQSRENLDRGGWLDMAIELQKDGLWERYALEPRLYVRYLWEDGAVVTQIFRPLREFP